MKITLTAGHSEEDPGAVYSGHTEQDLMTNLRDLVAGILLDRGHKVLTDGTRWLNLPLPYAMSLVPGSDVALELHTNAVVDPTAKGVEVVAMPGQKAKAQRLAKAIADVLEIPLRGERGWIDQTKTARGRLGFVRVGGMVVETFFLSNPGELRKYLERKDLVAKAIADACEAPAP